ncbi:MAG: transcription antitermination factor NusB [Ellagibacter isourolithinifaciens]|uniref:transcription antitermination factor NusB n=1 Tax=Ellagibacter isourolithinifaciens TaxID=2137581 RepID=UPI002E7A74C5|nr:transcription antitermination factor NusB [Ellagibacter isourolithinifaciens]MEE1454808.1 transcription antitermination factor NusB [Ellagibacter isourolithinifaciens]
MPRHSRQELRRFMGTTENGRHNMPDGNNQHNEEHRSNGGAKRQGSQDRRGRSNSGSYGSKRSGDHRGSYKGSRDGGKGGKGGYGKRDSRGGSSRDGEHRSRKPFDNERSDNRKSYGKRSDDRRSGGKSFSKQGDGNRKSYGKRDDNRKPYGKRDDNRGRDGERKPFNKHDGDRKPFDKREGATRDFDRAPRGDAPFKKDRADDRGFSRKDAGEHRGFERRGPWRPNEQNAALAEGREPQEGVYRGELELDENGELKYRNRPKGGERRGAKHSFGDKPRTSGVVHKDSERSASPARQAALRVTSIVRERDAFAQELIHKYIDSSRMSREDRAFATRLTLGVVSSYGTLDDVINRCLDRVSDINDDVRDALRISTYEIIFLKKEPHAAVSQGVELVKTIAPKASGLANAVLRRIADKAHKFPFGDPRTDIEAFARLHAFPEWLAKRALLDLGPEATRDYLAGSNEPAPLFVAINAAKADEAEVVETIVAAHGDPVAVSVNGEDIPGCYCLSEGRVLFDGRVRHMIQTGQLLVSDASSQQIARLVLTEEKPASLLEVGAGRGTKTVLIQSDAQRRYGSQIDEYVTVDNLEFKTNITAERAEEYGIHVSESITGDATALDDVVGKRAFDVVFIDAPCSGLGTLRRHPEIRWRLNPEKIDEFAKTGLALLKSASTHVTPGGSIVFSTCTITRAENIDVVKAFLASDEGASFSLAPIGGAPCFNPALKPGSPDAHFAVRLVKAAE